MRIVFDGDGERVHVWLPGGHGTLHGSEVRWHTPHAPFVAYAGVDDEEIHLPGASQLAVPDVVDAVAIDASRAAVVHGREALTLSIVDLRDGSILQTGELRVPGIDVDAFEASNGAEDLLDGRSDSFSSERPRGVRATVVGGRLGLASAESGHVASFSIEPLASELAFRVATRESDRLWALPIAEGLLVAARFDGRWSEVRALSRDGEVLGAWPDPAGEDGEERWGMVAPVVLGRYAVVCTDAPKAYVLELPSLREVHMVDLPGVPRDAHGAGDGFGCVTTREVVLGRLSGEGRLVIDRVWTPLELIERAGARQSATREVPEVEQRSFERRLDDVFPSDPMVLVTTEQSLTDERGKELVAPPPPDPFFGFMARGGYRLLDARGGRAVVSSSGATSLLELSMGALTQLCATPAADARILRAGVWLVHEQRPADAEDLFAQERVVSEDLFAQERFVSYVTEDGTARRLWVRRVGHRRWFHASAADQVVWTEPHDDDGRTTLVRFVEGCDGVETIGVHATLKNLALDGEALYAAAGDYTGHIVRIHDDGTVTRVSEDVFEWLDVLSDFVVAEGIAYWVTPYAHDQPQELRALELGRSEAPRVVYEASFGALSSLRVAKGQLWWLESQTTHAEHNGVHVLEPRAVVASMALGGARR